MNIATRLCTDCVAIFRSFLGSWISKLLIYLFDIFLLLQVECEPEYLMGEFDTNPDIDEKPPIPLRDALEKMKPFLMAYEGIQSQEEWEV